MAYPGIDHHLAYGGLAAIGADRSAGVQELLSRFRGWPPSGEEAW